MTYLSEYGTQTTVWNDYLSSISSGRVPPATAPTWSSFGPSGIQRAYSFAVNDFIYLEGFHILHDIKRNTLIYPHVHWSTDGVDTNTVKWEISYTVAKGHNQEAFPADTTISVEQAGSGTAWQHMISEVSQGSGTFTAPEVDSLILMRVKRVTNGGTDNADNVFGMFVDLHVEIDRPGTISKSPDFYG